LPLHVELSGKEGRCASTNRVAKNLHFSIGVSLGQVREREGLLTAKMERGKHTRSNRRHLLVIVILAFCALPFYAEEQRISQYAHRSWSVRDGFFNGAPLHVTQTTDGYIWVGTSSGLYRFDGSSFELWSSPDGQKLPGTVIHTLLGARDGSLWIGMGLGLARFMNHKLFVYPDFHDDVGGLFEDRSGNIWFTRSDAGGVLRTPICQALSTKVHCLDESDGVTTLSCCPHGLTQDEEGYIWAVTEGPLLRWKPGHSETYLPKEWEGTNGVQNAMGVVAIPDGSVLVAVTHPGPSGGLEKLSMGRWQPVKVPGFDGSKVKAHQLFRDNDGALWLGTVDEGIYHIHGNVFERFGTEDGLSGDYVRGFCQDRENGIWVVTTGGVDYFHPRNITTFSKREGLAADNADGVTVGPDGTVWLTNADSLDALKGGRVDSIQAGHGLPGRNPTAIFADSFETVWAGIDHDLYRYEQGKFQKVRGGGSSTRYIVGITEDSTHDIWAEVSGARRELIRVHGLQVVEEYPEAAVPSARALAAGPNGVLWLGLRSGDLARFHNGHAEIFPSPGGPKSYVYQVIVNPDGTIFATTSAGLVGWKDGRSHLLSSKNGLPCDTVIGAAWDSTGALWLSTACGLARISKVEMDRWWRDDTCIIGPKIFDVFDGVQPGRANFNPMQRAPDGRLWIANNSTLQVVDPAHLSQNDVLPSLQIEKVIANRKPYEPNDRIAFPPLMRDLEIDYAALSFVNPQKVRFRYMLEGRDTTWQDAGNRRQAFYTDLRPGPYRFRVVGSNDDGLWNEDGASLSFSIAPAWYQTAAFRISCVLAALWLLWVLYYVRMKQASRAIRARLDERSAERTRLARDLHDTLLQTLQGSKLVADDALDHRADTEYTRRSLEKLSDWIERAMRECRAALNALHASALDNRDLCKRLESALDEHSLNGIPQKSVTISGTPFQMDPIITDETYRIGYEAIRNAFMHSCATRLEVQLTYSVDFNLIVRDNGRGMDPTTASKGKDGHFGLQSMRERAARIHGQFQLISAPNLGTTIELKISGKARFGQDATSWWKLRSWLKGTRRSET
jgi:signal transduction histidine kinase/ligand-binding sensor domain-containing protein